MAHTVETRFTNPATQLREALDKAERLIVQVDRNNAEVFLLLLDQIDEMFERMAQDGIDLRSEDGRWQSLLNRLDSKPNLLVNAAAAAGGLAELRRRNPPAESFWWRLDATVAERRKRAIQRGLLTIGGLVLAAVLLFWGLDFFFPPDPQAVAMVEASNQIDRLVAEQRWEEALALVQEARQRLPNEPELAIWEVVLNEQMGNSDEAAAALEDAKRLYASDPVQTWIYLGNNRLMVGNLDGAEAAAQEAERINPDEAMVYFLQGGIAETRGDVTRAIDMFQKTSELAGDDNPQLNVIARVRMGQLLGGANFFTSPVETATPTP